MGTTAKLVTGPGLATARVRWQQGAADAVRAARGSASREAFAAVLGVDTDTVWRWETGRCAVPGWVLVAIQERRAA